MAMHSVKLFFHFRHRLEIAETSSRNVPLIGFVTGMFGSYILLITHFSHYFIFYSIFSVGCDLAIPYAQVKIGIMLILLHLLFQGNL